MKQREMKVVVWVFAGLFAALGVAAAMTLWGEEDPERRRGLILVLGHVLLGLGGQIWMLSRLRLPHWQDPPVEPSVRDSGRGEDLS